MVITVLQSYTVTAPFSYVDKSYQRGKYCTNLTMHPVLASGLTSYYITCHGHDCTASTFSPVLNPDAVLVNNIRFFAILLSLYYMSICNKIKFVRYR